MCSSVAAAAVSSFLDVDTKSRHCFSRTSDNLFWFTETANRRMKVCETHRAVDLEKVSLTMFAADVFVVTSLSATFSRRPRPN